MMFPPPPQTPASSSPASMPGMGMTPMGASSGGMGAPPPAPSLAPPPPPAPFTQPAPNPMAGAAQQMSQYGRGNDTMLMHVTPSEVQGLQGLAQMKGGSLTTNPTTGLPEAGFLEDILPTILGVAGMAFGIPPMITAGVVGAGAGLATGSLEKGLMAGLGAFGGASLGGAMGLGAAGAGAAGAGAAGSITGAAGATSPVLNATIAGLPNAATSPAALARLGTGFTSGAGAVGSTAVPSIGGSAIPTLTSGAANVAPGSLLSSAAGAGSHAVAGLAQPGLSAAAAQTPEWLAKSMGDKFGGQIFRATNRFAQAASNPMNAQGASMTGKISPMMTGAAGMGVAMPLMNAMQPQYAEPEDPNKGFNYEGPYRPSERTARFKPRGTEDDSSEFSYFDNTNPYPGFVSAPPAAGRGYASGGNVGSEERPVMPLRPAESGTVINTPQTWPPAPGGGFVPGSEDRPVMPLMPVDPAGPQTWPPAPGGWQPGSEDRPVMPLMPTDTYGPQTWPPVPPQPPIPPSRWNSAPPGRVQGPLGYGDQITTGFVSEQDHTIQPTTPRQPSGYDPVTGGGVFGSGGGRGPGTYNEFNVNDWFTEADIAELGRRFTTGFNPRTGGTGDVTQTEVTPGGGGGGSGGAGGSSTDPLLPLNPTSPPVAPPVVEPSLPPPPVAPPVVEPTLPPVPLNPRGGGSDVADEVSPGGGGGGGTGVDVYTPPVVDEPLLPPPPVVSPETWPHEPVSKELTTPPVLPPIAPPVVEPTLPPVPLNPRGGGFDVADEVSPGGGGGGSTGVDVPPVIEPYFPPPPPVVEPSLPPPPVIETPPPVVEPSLPPPPVLPPPPPPVVLDPPLVSDEVTDLPPPPVVEPSLPPPPPPVAPETWPQEPAYETPKLPTPPAPPPPAPPTPPVVVDLPPPPPPPPAPPPPPVIAPPTEVMPTVEPVVEPYYPPVAPPVVELPPPPPPPVVEPSLPPPPPMEPVYEPPVLPPAPAPPPPAPPPVVTLPPPPVVVAPPVEVMPEVMPLAPVEKKPVEVAPEVLPPMYDLPPPPAKGKKGKGNKYASGGSVPLSEGAFIMDARTVSELGNGSSSAGQELLARYGGRPIEGRGDGVSDSIPANINGQQQARVARDEVQFDPEAVTRLGGGDHAAGVKRLYALMDKAHKARKTADRGEDTNLRKVMSR